MKNYPRLTILCVVSLLLMGFVLGGHLPALVPGSAAILAAPSVNATVTEAGRMPAVQAAGVNFAAGKELAGGNAEAQNSQPTTLVSADFDSDGRPDLVTADRNGGVNLYRGNLNYLYPNTSQAKAQRAKAQQAGGSFDAEPLNFTGKTASVSTAPDFLFAGDFNADGHADVLAATRGDEFLHLLAGDGRGGFARERQIAVGGALTFVMAGEIGRADGQSDVAVSVTSSKGARLLVFEHPEGAFRYKPETLELAAPAEDIALGDLNQDSYNDIALGANDTLIVVFGRGQAYPWDMLKDSGIKRPGAFVQSRLLGFGISSLAFGNFGSLRGGSLAILSTDGSMSVLEGMAGTRKPAANAATRASKAQSATPKFSPAGLDARSYAVIEPQQPRSVEEADKLGLTLANRSLFSKDSQEEYSRQRAEKIAKADLSQLPVEERERVIAAEEQRVKAERELARAEFMRALAPRPAPLASFKLHTVIVDARLNRAASGLGGAKLVKLRVSTSGQDDLILLDPASRQIHIVTVPSAFPRNTQSAISNPQSEVISLDAEGAPVAVLPMRLNGDAMSDLIVLRAGSPNLFLVPSAPAQTFVVNTTADLQSGVCSGPEPCSLRRAITMANQTPGADAISFNIGGGGVQTIAPTSELPIIQDAVTIDGTTQPGFSGQPLIELKGVNLGSAGDGLRINGSGIVVRGLAINEFRSASNGGSQIGGNGISIFNYEGDSYSRANIIEGNYLGLDPTGSLDKGNDGTGLNIFDSDDNLVGGTTAAARNVMSGNGNPNAQPRKTGVGLSITAGERNQIKGNFIGTDASGVFKIPNSYGVFFTGKNNLFGGDEAGAGNVVSGNGDPVSGENRCVGSGINVALLISVDKEGTEELVTLDNNFKGNKIGTTFNGAAPLGNCSQGIKFDPSTRTVLGSITANGRNTISGNNYDAVWCMEEDSSFAPGFCQISGNNIGTDTSGTIAVPNDQRNIPSGLVILTGAVWVSPGLSELAFVGSPGGTTPGGACTGFCNLISGNDALFGVERSGLGNVLITNNHIGTDRAGTAALPNSGNGVFSFFNNDVFIGAVFVYQDGSRESGGNLISGNGAGGVLVDRNSGNASNTNFFVIGNLIGTSADGVNALPNNTGGDNAVTGHGITVFTNDFAQGFVGNVDPLARNVIAGNRGGGIRVQGTGHVSILNNYVGLNTTGAPLGNLTDGVVVRGRNTQVGGTGTNEANFIRNNGKAGVLIYETSYGISVPTNGIKVVGNSIAANGGLGIDLTKVYEFTASDGVTPNDCQDSDEGPNGLQNFPDLFAPTFNGDGTVTVEGALRSAPTQTFTLDFYANTAADPTEYGEGETHLGSKSVTTGDRGFIDFTFTSTAAVAPSQKITATATDAGGNTSEFSCFAGGCNAEPRPRTADGKRRAQPQVVTCGPEPIVVTITTDEEDLDGEAPEAQRDGHCDVSNLPEDQCSLRAAIQEANARAGFDSINFNITGTGGHTIAPTSPLPPIIQPVSINGSTQPGYSDDFLPKILLSGSNDTSPQNIAIGLSFISGSGGTPVVRGSIVEGLAINRWRNAGIKFSGSPESAVQSCHIGFGLGGSVPTDSGNKDGIFIEDSKGVRIGGTARLQGNVISNSVRNGITVTTSDCVIQNNKIGTSIDGTQAVKNGFNGIDLDGPLSIKTEVSENLMSGNEAYGIRMSSSRPSGVNNRIANNLIGTTADGMNALPNRYGGILIQSSTNNRIEGNTISGHNLEHDEGDSGGIVIGYLGSNADSNQIYDNKIGVGVDGTTPIPNVYGIRVRGSSGNQIGALGQPRNKISGNSKAGIFFLPDPQGIVSLGNRIINNHIGVSAGNEDGIRLGAGELTEINNNTISGNTRYGVVLVGADPNSTNGNFIHDNLIGFGAANRVGIGVKGRFDKVYQNIIFKSSDYNVLIGFQLGLDAAILHCGAEKNAIYDNQIEGDKIGIAVTEGACDNTIGGKGVGNKIFGHRSDAGSGIFLGATSSENEVDFPAGNKFYGNIVGEAQPDSFSNRVGMVIGKAKDNIIGSADEGLGNLFISNEEDGIKISGDKTKGNEITGNFIGFNPASPNEIASGNGRNGIYVVGGTGNLIKNNRIGYNRANGISVADVIAADGVEFSLQIAGNQIGVTQTNNSLIRIPNLSAGVKLENAQSVLIGSSLTTSTDSKNIISGNVASGVLITGESSRLNVINNSIIGTDESGTTGIGNAVDGIRIVGGEDNTIGGNSLIENTIAGNMGNGVYLQGSRVNKIQSNIIGLVRLGNVFTKLPNNQNGIKILEGEANEIGKSNPDSIFQNTIGGNGQSGIALQGANANGTKIIDNSIGTDKIGTNLGNALHGVFITEGARNTNVGGQGVNTGNRIAFNGTQSEHGGVVLGTAGTGNLIDPNEIFGNAGLGIDIGASGITPNDLHDPDTGPNNLQNYPEFSLAVINTAGNLIVEYKVDSTPGNSNYGADGLYVEFFKADAGLEGQTFIGSTHYTVTDYNNGTPGTATFSAGAAAGLGVSVGDKIVATATDADGNTSEFTGTNVGTVSAATAATAIIDGHVSTSDGVPVAGVTINLSGTQSRETITNSNGQYRFTEVETTGFYTVTPARANFNFTPANRSFSVIGNKTEAVFTAVADATETANPLDTPEFFVRQQYLDFLGREPDAGGFTYWTSAIAQCGTDESCLRRKRIDVSNAFFYEQEFQESGGYVYRLYKAALGERPTFAQFQSDRSLVIGGANLEQRKNSFALAFVQREAFLQAYPRTQTAEQFVDALLAGIKLRSGADLIAERSSLLDLYDGTDHGRATILRRLVETRSFVDAEYNASFVLTQYFGYLRRDPEPAGYDFWLSQVNSAPLRDVARQHAMVCSFLTSAEYQLRFSSVVTHSNTECGQ